MGSKISQLTEVTAPSSGNDQLEIIINTETTPLNRRIKFLNLLKRVFLGDGTQLTITTIADGEFLKRNGTNIIGATPSTGAPSVVDETGGPVTLDGSHDGNVVLVDDDVTVPSGLGAGFSAMLIQTGATAVEIIESGTTVNNRQGHVHIAGRYGVVTLFAYASNVFVMGGDTAT